MKWLVASAVTAGLLGMAWPASVQAQQYTMPGQSALPQSNQLYNPWGYYHPDYYSQYRVAPMVRQPLPSQAPPWVRPFNPQGMAHDQYDQVFKPTPRYYRPPLNVPYGPPVPLNNPWPSGW
ncbi:MAG TPA: hypothetical protein VFA18_14645 [Gemmataceae bacterium]|nr:hypothetical protein [Gemmataceae bacterium]